MPVTDDDRLSDRASARHRPVTCEPFRLRNQNGYVAFSAGLDFFENIDSEPFSIPIATNRVWVNLDGSASFGRAGREKGRFGTLDVTFGKPSAKLEWRDVHTAASGKASRPRERCDCNGYFGWAAFEIGFERSYSMPVVWARRALSALDR